MLLNQWKLTLVVAPCIAIGLSACSSTSSVFTIQSNDEQWFCTPVNSEEWNCSQSQEEFRLIEKRQAAVKQQQAKPGLAESASSNPENIANTEEKAAKESLLSKSNSNTQLNHTSVTVSSASNSHSEPVKRHTTAKTSRNIVPKQNSPKQSTPRKVKDSSADTELTLSPWIIQLAAYRKQSHAETLVAKVGEGRYFKTQVNGVQYFTVVIIGFDNRQAAESEAKRVQRKNPELAPWIRRGDSFSRNMIN